jgi:hypothetical protein
VKKLTQGQYWSLRYSSSTDRTCILPLAGSVSSSYLVGGTTCLLPLKPRLAPDAPIFPSLSTGIVRAEVTLYRTRLGLILEVVSSQRAHAGIGNPTNTSGANDLACRRPCEVLATPSERNTNLGQQTLPICEILPCLSVTMLPAGPIANNGFYSDLLVHSSPCSSPCALHVARFLVLCR